MLYGQRYIKEHSIRRAVKPVLHVDARRMPGCWWRCCLKGILTRSYTLQLITIHKQRLGMTGLRDHWLPGDILPGFSFLRGQNVFEGVPNGMSYISMLLAEAVASGPFCLEFWPELHSDPDLVPCFSRQAWTALTEASDPCRMGHWCNHWLSIAGHLSWNCGQGWVTTHLPHRVQTSQLPCYA